MKKISKKSNRRGPLTLNKETLRNLSKDGESVAGGTFTTLFTDELCPIPQSIFCPSGGVCTLWSKARPCPNPTWGGGR